MEDIFYCEDGKTVAETTKGKVRGYYYDGVYCFKGMEYATAKRFHQPEETAEWEGIKDATSYGYVCPLMQEARPSGEVLVPHVYWLQNENCLNLNVWTPGLDDAHRAVVVWLHGGGFESGSAIEQIAYDGENLSRSKDVVVVTVNHRLNILGYLNLSEFGPVYENAQNAGQEDIIAALRWIRDNIAGFGGDPGNVTIFGQSGGGGKVTALLQMPEAEGLFHKAMIMSGILADGLMDIETDTRPVVREMLASLRILPDQMELLEKIPYSRLVDAYMSAYRKVAGSGRPYFGPVVNEHYLGQEAKAGICDFAKKIPVLCGSVFAEFSAYRSPYDASRITEREAEEIVRRQYGEEKGGRIIEAMHEAYPEKSVLAVLSMDSYAVRKPTRNWILNHARLTDAPVYSYLFSCEMPYNGGTQPWHCADIPFFFRNTEKVPVANRKGITERLEDQMSSAFVNFARTGVPGAAGLPEWIPCREGREHTMLFDGACRMRTDFDRKLLEELPDVNPFLTVSVEDIQH